MPAARVKAFERRPAHEGREIAEATADLARGGAEENEIVGRFERGSGCECAFHLSGAPFIFKRSKRKIQFLQRIRHRGKRHLHPVQIGFRMERISRLDRIDVRRAALEAGRPDVLKCQMLLGAPQQVPFDLEADAALHPSFCQALDLSPQQMPRRKIERLAGDEIFVAQNPADIRLPGKHPKGCGIGNDDAGLATPSFRRGPSRRLA